MKVLTSAEMREADRRTEELGIPGPILMENAGCRVVEFLVDRFQAFSDHHILVVCGKGNNGGDGYVVARQLLTRFHIRRLDVVAVEISEHSDARRMFEAAGGTVSPGISPEMYSATIVVDAVLGTGLNGPARGTALECIEQLNGRLTKAFRLSIDVPSGMQSDSGLTKGVKVESPHATVTFTAPKPCHVLSPNCDELGELRVAPIGTPSRLLEASKLHLSEPSEFRSLLAPRARESNKGTYGHVLVLGGAAGKHGAALMTGLAALRSGAGLVTVASSAEQLGVPELMTARLPSGIGELGRLVDRKDVLAVGPGLGSSPEHVQLVRDLVSDIDLPMTIDADGLNALVGCSWNGGSRIRVLTPHPGEMARLLGVTIPDVQADRVYHASRFATSHGCILVLKGYRTVIALPDGRCWINPTGTPALATGGTGDILAGMIAAFLHTPDSPPHLGVLAAIFLHGLAAQIGERTWGERGLIATDILTYLPEALRECTRVSDRI